DNHILALAGIINILFFLNKKNTYMINKLTLSCILGSLIPLSFSAQTKKDLTFDDIFSRNTFMMKSVAGFNSMKNDDYFTTVALNKSNSTQEIVLKKQHIKNAQDISEVINVTQIMSSRSEERRVGKVCRSL